VESKYPWMGCRNPFQTNGILRSTLILEGTTISTSTYPKDLNLYLYLPPRSAHPPSCLKGLIAGQLRRYWLQNGINDFQTMLTRFIKRLIDRGHRIEDLTPLLQQAALAIDHNKTPHANAADSHTLFIHWRYHPHGIQWSDLRTCYNETLKQVLDYNKMTVVISRPKNLRDILSKKPWIHWTI